MKQRLYRFDCNFSGITKTFNIVADNISVALVKGREECIKCVGDSYQAQASDGHYITKITVLEDVIIA